MALANFSMQTSFGFYNCIRMVVSVKGSSLHCDLCIGDSNSVLFGACCLSVFSSFWIGISFCETVYMFVLAMQWEVSLCTT